MRYGLTGVRPCANTTAAQAGDFHLHATGETSLT